MSLVTPAHGVVVLDGAVGVDSTSARAGVDTLAVDAGQLGGTVIAEETLRLTSNERISCNTTTVTSYLARELYDLP